MVAIRWKHTQYFHSLANHGICSIRQYPRYIPHALQMPMQNVHGLLYPQSRRAKLLSLFNLIKLFFWHICQLAQIPFDLYIDVPEMIVKLTLVQF